MGGAYKKDYSPRVGMNRMTNDTVTVRDGASIRQDMVTVDNAGKKTIKRGKPRAMKMTPISKEEFGE